jgi:hypothetical protein
MKREKGKSPGKETNKWAISEAGYGKLQEPAIVQPGIIPHTHPRSSIQPTLFFPIASTTMITLTARAL